MSPASLLAAFLFKQYVRATENGEERLVTHLFEVKTAVIWSKRLRWPNTVTYFRAPLSLHDQQKGNRHAFEKHRTQHDSRDSLL